MARLYIKILIFFIVLTCLSSQRQAHAGGAYGVRLSMSYGSAYPSQIWLDTFAYSPGTYSGPGYYATYFIPYYGYSSYPNVMRGGTRSVDYYVNRAQTKLNTPVIMTPKQMAVYKAKPPQKVLW